MNECCEPAKPDNGKNYDLCVIGAGSAGFSAAITAADQGAQVALIGSGTIGGTCVNVGCVPSKTLIRAAESLHGGQTAGRFAGITGDTRLTDWGALIRQKDELVASLRKAKYLDLLPEYNNIAYIEGSARLRNGGLDVNGQHLNTGRIIVTTGSHPALPDIPGIDGVEYLTSTSAMELPDLPASMIVVGGGYIGCELAQMFSRAGSKVTIVCRSRLLPGTEPEISDALTRYFSDEGIRVVSGIQYENVANTSSGVELEVRAGDRIETLTAQVLLLATGRAPNTAGLGLKDAGIETDTRGAIKVDERMRTNKAGVYAAGDVTGLHQFVYMAAYGARLAAENALNGDSQIYDASAMPSVTFTDPQVAGVGLTEAEARTAGYDVKTTTLPLDQVPRALAARDTRGLIKLVADGRSDRLLGAHIIAPEGADSIQTAAIAIKAKMTARALGQTIFPYLTTVEGLKLAAQTFEKDISKLSCCAG